MEVKFMSTTGTDDFSKEKKEFAQSFDDVVDNNTHIKPDNKNVQSAFKHHKHLNPDSNLTVEQFAERTKKANITAAMESERLSLGIPSVNSDLRKLENDDAMHNEQVAEWKKLHKEGKLKIDSSGLLNFTKREIKKRDDKKDKDGGLYL